MAAKLPPFPGTTGKRDWRTAFDAIKKLLNNGDDTVQVFRIMRALNTGSTEWGYAKLLETENGGRIALEQANLAERFSDRSWVDTFAPGTVGAAYRDFLDSTGYSADGLVEVSKVGNDNAEIEHPYAWFGRRTRDMHDIWHVLTGYKADESLGEAALVAFSYAQVGGLGWAFIGSAAALKSFGVTKNTLFARAVAEGFKRGKQAKWLAGEDVLQLMHEPLGAARKRLGLTEPVMYKRAQRELGEEMASYLSARREAAAEPERLAA
ncbi:ubiquinone biosynthesis protein [Sphingomonas sp. NBWT7]|uniref:Coq4 family protein n=1 Tax=Sphingomonas sp. NBWT7 TaxID=2596913 RepID=UPI00162818A6|nr:Coq4 family protein [Sphingomonas sp. NBWT7]QNE31608.1 ubiquinone biosynthesis protein [Sphingomonas sp. NBWT7]